MQSTKICTKCKERKPLGEFGVCSKSKSGLFLRCKLCINEYAMENRWKNIEASMMCNKKIRIKNKKKINFQRNERTKRDWKSTSAKNKVFHALRTKKLIRGKCLFCGDGKVEAHHDNYDYPFEITWCCKPCHIELHIIYRAIGIVIPRL